MKYLILVPDGAADDPIEALGNRTPLEVAEMPNINELAHRGTVGMVRTIPPGVEPGSDAANLSVMGYDPAVYLTGRSPLEAASMGIDMSDTDVSFRTNIITLTCDGKNPPKGDEAYDDLIITDHSSGDISTEEADQLIQAVNEAFANEEIRFYTGISYRHCLIVHNGSIDYDLTPPHDVLGEKVGDYLPKKGANGGDPAFIEDMMRRSYEIFKEHPVNKARIAAGKNPANTIWVWGQGTKPSLSSFYDKYGITGTAISAVDLIKGIALCAGLCSVDVEGVTGTLHTNFAGKAEAAIREFRDGKDFIYMHLEGPDECSHQGDMDGKIECLKSIDIKVLKPIIEALREDGEDYRILVVPDHRTPISIRTHSADPVPFVLYDSTKEEPFDEAKRFHEKSGEKGMYFDSGHELADYFFEK